MSKVKKQHFVPQFYLRNFTNSKGNSRPLRTFRPVHGKRTDHRKSSRGLNANNVPLDVQQDSVIRLLLNIELIIFN